MGVVKNPTGSVSRFTTPIKAWTQRFAFLFLVVGAFSLMLIGKADTVLVERVRGAVGDAAAPILEFIARPIDTIGNTVEGIGELTELRAAWPAGEIHVAVGVVHVADAALDGDLAEH